MADSHKHHHDNYRRHKGGRRKGEHRERKEVKPLHDWHMSDEELKATPFGMLGLSPKVIESVLDMGYKDPTPVQAQAIPQVLAGHDVMAAAQTGTGKTAAFLLPGLDRLPHVKPGEGPLMLVVTPTRELAQQIETVATSVCARTGHKAATVVGGVSYNPQRKALERGCDLLVATPGRLIDLMNQGACHLDQVQLLVLDEADRMLDMGFLPDVEKIVEQTPDTRQTLLFSATLDESVLKHVRDLVNDPVHIEIAHRGTTADTVEQYVIGTEHLAKASLLVQLLKQEGSQRVIVFTNSKHRADTLAKKLEREGITCDTIHGDRSQHQRMMALKSFAKGKVDVLVATDVLSRGIDVPDVSYVINFDVPFDDPEDYIHRVGRTGRAGEEGWAVTFVTAEDYLCLRYVEQILGKVIPPFPRTEGLDLGEEPFELDPDRDPSEKLPSKKGLRRKLKRQGKKGKGGGKKGRRDGDKKRKDRDSRSDSKRDEKPLNRSERRAQENSSPRVAAKAKPEDSWAKFEKNHRSDDSYNDDFDGRRKKNKHSEGYRGGNDWRDDRSSSHHKNDNRRGGSRGSWDNDNRGHKGNGKGHRDERRGNRNRDYGERGGRHFSNPYDDQRGNRNGGGYNGNRHGKGGNHGNGGHYGKGRGHARVVNTNADAVYRPGRAKKRYSRHPGDHGHQNNRW